MRRICVSEARRFLRNRDDAEEAVQEALVRAWRRRETCRAEAPLGWLLQITRNESLRVIQRKNRQNEQEFPSGREPEGSPDQELERALGAITLDQVIAPLPHDDRALMRLRYLHDLSQAELAQLFRMPEGTIKVRLYRSRLRVRRALERSL
jgi:RNA polymerase sigma-70 factor (ECF subfamily)